MDQPQPTTARIREATFLSHSSACPKTPQHFVPLAPFLFSPRLQLFWQWGASVSLAASIEGGKSWLGGSSKVTAIISHCWFFITKVLCVISRNLGNTEKHKGENRSYLASEGTADNSTEYNFIGCFFLCVYITHTDVLVFQNSTLHTDVFIQTICFLGKGLPAQIGNSLQVFRECLPERWMCQNQSCQRGTCALTELGSHIQCTNLIVTPAAVHL